MLPFGYPVVPPPAQSNSVSPVSSLNEASLPGVSAKAERPIRLAYFVSHPIQYQAPLLRRIAQEPDIDLTVFFSSDLSVRAYKDPGFGVSVQWDVPLLDGYKYEFLPRLRDSDRLGFASPLNWGIFNRLRRGRFDAVWVFGYHRLACLNAILAAKLLGMPVLLRSDSCLFDRARPQPVLAAKRIFARMLRPAVSCVTAVGRANKEYWQHYFGSRFPVFTMPYAIDNDLFRNRALQASPQREELRRELGLQAGLPVILFASKLQTDKRCSDLLDAYMRLGPEGGEPPACLLIVGDGEERPSLEAWVRDKRLSRVHFLGFRNQKELPRFFDLCDVFVLPSSHDAWGLIVNEVMNAGRPVIVTDRVGCYPDLVQNGFNGFVYPALDVDALTRCLRQLIEDPALRSSMGGNSLRVIQQYSFEEDVKGLRGALAKAVIGFARRHCQNERIH